MPEKNLATLQVYIYINSWIPPPPPPPPPPPDQPYIYKHNLTISMFCHLHTVHKYKNTCIQSHTNIYTKISHTMKQQMLPFLKFSSVVNGFTCTILQRFFTTWFSTSTAPCISNPLPYRDITCISSIILCKFKKRTNALI